MKCLLFSNQCITITIACHIEIESFEIVFHTRNVSEMRVRLQTVKNDLLKIDDEL